MNRNCYLLQRLANKDEPAFDSTSALILSYHTSIPLCLQISRKALHPTKELMEP